VILSDLKKFPLVYLATPYSKYPKGLEHAARDAAWLAARLTERGLGVYSPIVHCHYMAVHGKLAFLDHDFWLRVDVPLMDKADALIVTHMEGWEDSYGIIQEIKHFSGQDKPIFHLDPLTLEIL